MMQGTRIAALVALALGCGHATTDAGTPVSREAPVASAASAVADEPTTPATTSPVAEAVPTPPTPVVAAPSAANAIYTGSIYGPVVRIADDGSATALSGPDGSVGDFSLDTNGVVHVALSGQVFAIVEDALERECEGEPARFVMLAARSRNDVWAASSRVLAHSDGTSWTVLQDVALAGHEIRDIAFDASGTLWVLTRDTILVRRGTAFETLAPMEGSAELGSWVRNVEGGLDVVHFRGIDHFDGSTWSIVPLDWVERSHQGRLTFVSLSRADYANGMLALGTLFGDDFALRLNDVRYLGESSLGRLQVPATQVNGVAVDGRGRPWLATDGGLLVLERYGTPRVLRFWPVHGLAALARVPRVVFAVGDGPSVLPDVLPARPGRARGSLGARYAGATVVLCTDVEGSGRERECSDVAMSFSANADSRGRFTIEGVVPGGYTVLARIGGTLYQTTGSCCAPREPGGEVDLDRIDVER